MINIYNPFIFFFKKKQTPLIILDYEEHLQSS